MILNRISSYLLFSITLFSASQLYCAGYALQPTPQAPEHARVATIHPRPLNPQATHQSAVAHSYLVLDLENANLEAIMERMQKNRTPILIRHNQDTVLFNEDNEFAYNLSVDHAQPDSGIAGRVFYTALSKRLESSTHPLSTETVLEKYVAQEMDSIKTLVAESQLSRSETAGMPLLQTNWYARFFRYFGLFKHIFTHLSCNDLGIGLGIS